MRNSTLIPNSKADLERCNPCALRKMTVVATPTPSNASAEMLEEMANAAIQHYRSFLLVTCNGKTGHKMSVFPSIPHSQRDPSDLPLSQRHVFDRVNSSVTILPITIRSFGIYVFDIIWKGSDNSWEFFHYESIEPIVVRMESLPPLTARLIRRNEFRTLNISYETFRFRISALHPFFNEISPSIK